MFDPSTDRPQEVIDLERYQDHFMGWDHNPDPIDFVKSRGLKRGAGKTALVAETQLDFGLGRMSRSLAESENVPWEIRAFRSMAEAEAWIG